MLQKMREMECVFIFLCLFRLIQTVFGECTVDSPKEADKIELLASLNGKAFDITDASGEYKYSIRFCEPVEGEDDDVGVMQYGQWKNDTDKQADKHIVGRITDTDIKTGSNWILLTYKNGQPYGSHCGKEERQAHIMILCNKDGMLMTNELLVEENNEKEKDCSYMFELESKVACTGPLSRDVSKSLSAGSIFCIIFLVVLVSYLFFGFMYNRYILGAKGLEQFPNVTFWKDFGNLEADGCDLIFRNRPAEEPRSYKGLGDDQLGLDEDEDRDDHLLPMY